MTYKVITLKGIEVTFPNEAKMRAMYNNLIIDANTSEYDLDADTMTIRVLRGDTKQENRGNYIGSMPSKNKAVKFDLDVSELDIKIITVLMTLNSMASLKSAVMIRDDLRDTVIDLKKKGLIAYDSTTCKWARVNNG